MRLIQAALLILLFVYSNIQAQTDRYVVKPSDVAYDPFKNIPTQVESSGNTSSSGDRKVSGEQKNIPAQSSSQKLPLKNGPNPQDVLFDNAKKKCSELGFRVGTDKFGNCVLTLTK